MAKPPRQALGRGLKGMLGAAPQSTAAVATTAADADAGAAASLAAPLALPLNQIHAAPFQPRQNFDETKLAELAESIKALGLVQPLVVRKIADGNYQLLAGERRLRAVTMLGWTTVPVTLSGAGADELREIALVENLQRENLNAMETAAALQELCSTTALTHEKIAERLGKSRVWITNSMRLLNLPQEVRDLIAADQLSGAHGRTLLGLPDALSQINLAKRAVAEQIPVQKLEKLVQTAVRGKKPAKTGGKEIVPPPENSSRGTNRYLRDLEHKLCEHLSAQVAVRDDGGHGEITIRYNSLDEIAAILSRLGMASD